MSVGTALSLAVTPPRPASAQTVEGHLLRDSVGTGIVGAFVLLVDSAGREVARDVTGPDGEFTLRAPGIGVFHLQSAVIGWRSARTPPFTLGSSTVLRYTFVVRPEMVRLDALVVTGERRCETPAAAGAAVVGIWEEARKALSAVTWTRTAARYRFRWIEYARTLHPRSLQTRDESSSEGEGVFVRGPFGTVNPEALWILGFVRELDGGGWEFEGPDAPVLLSDRFAGLHCFGVTADEKRPDLIGLAFQPVGERDLPDIAGTLWLDRHSGELRRLEFRFVQLPWDIPNDNVGGHVEFQRLPSGLWTIRRWWLRMPVLHAVRGPALMGGRARVRYSIRQIKEEGALITEVRETNGRPVLQGAPATVIGAAYDSLRMAPLIDAEVSLSATSYRTRTDPRGRFTLQVPAGTYLLTLRHPDLEAAPPMPASRELAVLPAETLQVWVGVPSREAWWAEHCPDVALTDGVGAITGVVSFEAMGDPAAGASVSAQARGQALSSRSQPYDVRRGEVVSLVTGRDGRYALCGVEPDIPITLRAATGDAQTGGVVVWGEGGTIVRRDLVLRSRN